MGAMRGSILPGRLRGGGGAGKRGRRFCEGRDSGPTWPGRASPAHGYCVYTVPDPGLGLPGFAAGDRAGYCVYTVPRTWPNGHLAATAWDFKTE
jgi:hypothetical protein